MSPDPTSRARLNELREHVRETLHPTIDHAALREHADQVNEWANGQRLEEALTVMREALDLAEAMNVYAVEFTGPNGGLARLRRMLAEHLEANDRG